MEQSKHTLTLYDRKLISISGVREVKSFDERGVELYLESCSLFVTGEALNVSKLDVEKGLVDVSGKIDSVEYADKNPNAPFWQRIRGK